MFIAIHVIVAISALCASSYALARPNRRLIISSYVLVALTVLSGVYLVFADHAPVLRTCVTGLIFVTITTTNLSFARRRLDDSQLDNL